METSTLGVHNEATDNHVKISHQGGDLLAIWQTNIVDQVLFAEDGKFSLIWRL